MPVPPLKPPRRDQGDRRHGRGRDGRPRTEQRLRHGADAAGQVRRRSVDVPVRPGSGPAHQQPLARQSEPHPGLSPLHRRRPPAVQLPRQPPALHQRRGPERRMGRPGVPLPHPRAGPLPHGMGPGLRRGRGHHLPRQGRPHGGRTRQVPGQQLHCGLLRRLPVGLSRGRLHQPRSRQPEQRQRPVLLRPQDHGRSARRVAPHRQHPGPRCAPRARRLGRPAHRRAQPEQDAVAVGRRVRRHERGAGRPSPADRRRTLADYRPAVRPCGGLRPPRREPGPTERSARQHAGAQVDRSRPRVQGHRDDPLPRHRRQRVGDLHHLAHLRHRRQQPGGTLPGPERHLRLPRPRHLRALQLLQHAQADPRTVAVGPGPGVVLRLLREVAAQPRHRRPESGRPPRARHLLHPPQPGRPPRQGPGVGRRYLEHRLRHVLVLPGNGRRVQHKADGLHLLPRRQHHPHREPVPPPSSSSNRTGWPTSPPTAVPAATPPARSPQDASPTSTTRSTPWGSSRTASSTWTPATATGAASATSHNASSKPASPAPRASR